MSSQFSARLSNLHEIVEEFGTPFHIYDEKGILEHGRRLNQVFSRINGFREYFAVKALPNPEILKIMTELGFGFDCSSVMELQLCDFVGASGEDIMFTSNNTTWQEFEEAQKRHSIINLDDISLVPKVLTPFPELVCFRFNPGKARTGNSIIGKPFEAKYGITWKQLIPAYRAARERGATRFGIHTMVCSNQRNYRYMVETVVMLLELCATLERRLGIKCEFMNMGGGIGIPYRPTDASVHIERMASEIKKKMDQFKSKHGWVPKLFMESGRYITGPHGALITKVINRKDIYQKHVGVDAGMPALMRHAMYGAYHHITVHGKLNKYGACERVNVVGSICENCDRLATQRLLPKTKEGDILVVHDTGAHGIAMGFNYNGRLRPQELLLKTDGSIVKIRRAETTGDLWTTLEFED